MKLPLKVRIVKMVLLATTIILAFVWPNDIFFDLGLVMFAVGGLFVIGLTLSILITKEVPHPFPLAYPLFTQGINMMFWKCFFYNIYPNITWPAMGYILAVLILNYVSWTFMFILWNRPPPRVSPA